MTNCSQMLQKTCIPLTSKRNRQAFFAYLQQNHSHVRQAGNHIYVGDPEQAKLILSAQTNGHPSGLVVLTELLDTLAEPLKKDLCFAFTDKPPVMPGKLHVRIGNLSKGNALTVLATAGIRKDYAAVIKKAFLPGKSTSLQFQKAETLLKHFPKDRRELLIHTKKTLFKPAPTDLQGNRKLVCDGILRFTKLI